MTALQPRLYLCRWAAKNPANYSLGINQRPSQESCRIATKHDRAFAVSFDEGSCKSIYYVGVPRGIRTPVTAVKGRCPRPLDDGDLGLFDGRHRSNAGLTCTLLHARKFGILAQQIKNLKLISGERPARQNRARRDRKINHLKTVAAGQSVTLRVTRRCRGNKII